MRLIDADALKEKCGDWYTEEGPEEGFIGRLGDLLDKAPTIEFDKDNGARYKPTPGDPFCLVIISAVRYCLGRRTYMPDVVTRWIMASVPELPAETALIMLRDINEQRRLGELVNKREGITIHPMGDECDIKTWERFEAWLQGRISDDG